MAKIAINPGHHPILDSGAVGPTGLREADVAMAVAKKLNERLTEVGYSISILQCQRCWPNWRSLPTLQKKCC